MAGLRQQVITNDALALLYQSCPPAPTKPLIEPAGFTQLSLDLIRWLIPMLQQEIYRHNFQDGKLQVNLQQTAIEQDDRNAVSAFFRRARYKVRWSRDTLVARHNEPHCWSLTISWLT